MIGKVKLKSNPAGRSHLPAALALVLMSGALCAVLPGSVALASGQAMIADQAQSAVSAMTVIKALIESGQYEAALGIAKSSARTEDNKHLQEDFTRALILKHQKHLKEAAAAMRSILANHPELQSVQAELAHTLFLMKDYDAAAYHFEQLSELSSSQRSREVYQTLLNRSRQARSWTLSGYVSLAPSTNFSNGSASEIVYIAGVPFRPGQTAKSGIGVNFGINGSYRFDLSDQDKVIVGGGISGSKFPDELFDTTRFNGFTAFSRSYKAGSVAVGVAAEYYLKANKPYRFGIGPYLSAQRSFGRAGTSSAFLSYKVLDYIDDDAFDGREIALSLGHRYAIDAKTGIAVNGDLAYTSARQSFNAHIRYGAKVQLIRKSDLGLIMDVAMEVSKRDYVGDFPLTGKPRSDLTLTPSAGVTLRNFSYKGFAPRVELSYSRNFSNVDLYDYDNKTAQVTLTKNF